MAPPFVYAAMAVAGVLLATFAFALCVQAWRMRRWIATTAVVTGVHVDSDDEGIQRPCVRYAYEVDGAHWSGEAVLGAMHGRSRKRAQARLAGHPVGSRLEVFRDPARPARSALRPSWPRMLACVIVLLGAAAQIVAAAIAHLR